ncbi:hypothetical protein FA15DRAFT_711193 [Coprinopsis marcescibilis]|uniref:Uncharacterized protein n=1 Tax=Coprinopsis marcescibilis TaxID=230819 RepID=A0A5C3KAV5_COPMA|nr:hypothetical protein FA15DRAFT_711193 [Coprinopsis marcescibilis]
MTDRVLEVRILGGEHDQQAVFIPRISLIPTDTNELTFKFRRRQFPVRLAFALTINKAQGQAELLSGIVVLENGRVLKKEKSARDHVFDTHLFILNDGPAGDDALGILRYFNMGDPLVTPHAYFISAQISGMPDTPDKLPQDYLKTHNLLFNGLDIRAYKLIGDIKQLIPFGPVNPEAEDAVDPRTPAYICLLIKPYVSMLGQATTIDAKKRKGFIQQGSYVSVEGSLCGLDTVMNGDAGRRINLELRVEEVTLLGKAPVPSVEGPFEILDDTPLKGKRKAEPITPLKFSYSNVRSKRARIEDSASSPLSTQASTSSECSQ